MQIGVARVQLIGFGDNLRGTGIRIHLIHAVHVQQMLTGGIFHRRRFDIFQCLGQVFKIQLFGVPALQQPVIKTGELFIAGMKRQLAFTPIVVPFKRPFIQRHRAVHLHVPVGPAVGIHGSHAENTGAIRTFPNPFMLGNVISTAAVEKQMIQPKALGVGVKMWPSTYSTIYKNEESFFTVAYRRLMAAHFVQRALQIANFLTFPDRKLIQYDSGKLQRMSILLKRLRAQNSKVLIFPNLHFMRA